MRVIARRCIPLRFGASRSEDLRLERVEKAPAPCGSWPCRSLRSMDQTLCRRLMPRPTTAAATPATSRLVHLKVVGPQQMAIAAESGYGHGLEDAFEGKAHHISFGCSKARPRYQFQRFAPICDVVHRPCWLERHCAGVRPPPAPAFVTVWASHSGTRRRASPPAMLLAR